MTTITLLWLTVVILLYGIYSGNSSEYPYADSMFDLLAAQTRRNKIPAQMPSDAKTANKTGELDNVENDAGIVYDVDNRTDPGFYVRES